MKKKFYAHFNVTGRFGMTETVNIKCQVPVWGLYLNNQNYRRGK